MLTIRNEQLESLKLVRRQEFEAHLVETLASEYPTSLVELKEAGLLRVARHAIDCGESNGIVTKGGVTALAGLMIQYGDSFERSPDREWAQETLSSAKLPEQLKVEFLIERLAGPSQGRVIVEQGED